MVDRLLAHLPPLLARQARLTQFDLGLRYAASGQFRDSFLGPDAPPVLSIGTWLLHDLARPSGRPAVDVEARLFVASVLLAMRTHLVAAIDDATSFTDEAHMALVRYCGERSIRELMAVIPSEAVFWPEHEAISLAELEAGLEARERAPDAGPPEDPDGWLRSRWSYPARLVAAAVLALTGRSDLAPSLLPMLDDLFGAIQVRLDVRTLHEDLLSGRITYPIAAIAHEGALPLRPMPRPEHILGLIVALDPLPAVLDVALDRLDDCRAIATDLGLDLLAGFIEDAGRQLASERPRLLAEPREGDHERPRAAPRAPSARGPLVHLAEPALPKAMAMASGYLLSDPTFRESWEWHREGMLGADVVASRFPAGLILELLCASGTTLTDQVDDFLALSVAHGFRYYDHPGSPSDTDTLGACLRLLRFASQPGRYVAPLEDALRLLDGEVATRGAVPVWLPDPGANAGGRDDAVALGEGCGTVMAHLLLGLLEHPTGASPSTIAIGSDHLLRRISDVGLGANVNYPPDYALAIFYRLLAALDASDFGRASEGPTAAARRVLDEELDRATARHPRSAQAAALLTIACRDAGRPDRVVRGWMTTILRGQRSDGSWIGEPFAVAPNRGTWVSWYSSTTLTTALCHEALAIHARSAAPPATALVGAP